MLAVYPPESTNAMSKNLQRSQYAPKKSRSRPLMFVNADAGSLGAQDTKRRTRDVKSYLSGHYRKWKRQQTLTAGTNKIEEELPVEDYNEFQTTVYLTSASTPSPAGPKSSSPASSTSLSLSSSSSLSEISSEDAEYRDTFTDDQYDLTSSSGIAIWQNSLSHGNSDPFGVLPIAVDAKTNMHIQIFNRGTTVVCWTTQVDNRLKNLLHHEALMHGVLAISKMLTAVYLPVHRHPLALIPESRQHYGELLRLMRAYLQDRNQLDSDIAIEMMHAAMMFAFLARQYDEFDIHFTSLQRLISGCGGLKTIRQEHSQRFLNAQQLRSLFLLKTPLLPPEEWAPRSSQEESQFRPYDPIYRMIWSGLSLTEVPAFPLGRFNSRVQSLFADFRDLLAAGGVGAMLWKTKNASIDVFGDWMTPRSHALGIKTAEVFGAIKDAKDLLPSLELSLQACACLAVSFIAHLIRSTLNPTFGLSYLPFSNLMLSIREATDYVRYGVQLLHQQLYLWTLFIGACAELASRTWSCDPSFRGSSWCSINFAFMIEKMNIQTIDELRANLLQYLFPDMFESYLIVLFNRRHQLIQLSAGNPPV